jgi:hypothetical protein
MNDLILLRLAWIQRSNFEMDWYAGKGNINLKALVTFTPTLKSCEND